MTDRPCLILNLREFSGEAAWQLAEFLKFLAEHIDAHYSAQILRARWAYECEQKGLYRERLHLEAQQPLPFADPSL